jgi:hypothetical protein
MDERGCLWRDMIAEGIENSNPIRIPAGIMAVRGWPCHSPLDTRLPLYLNRSIVAEAALSKRILSC